MSPGEWLQFLGHARGSLYEIQTQIILARRLGYISEESEGQLMHGAAGVGQTLAGLIKYVQRKKEQNEQHNA